MKPESTTTIPSFEELGVSTKFLSALQRMNITVPTPIQHKAMPSAFEGKDILGIAQTGTGKTLAFGLPILQKLQTGSDMALILLPTRELAEQVNESLQSLCRSVNVRTAVLIGGVSPRSQYRDLDCKPRLIIATPGRLLDMVDQRRVRFDALSILVLDEADRMMDMGFAPQLKEILKCVPKTRQTLLFSATMPAEVTKFAHSIMKSPVRIEAAPAGSTASDIMQEVYITPQDKKQPLLQKLLEEREGSVIVFSRTKHGAKKITRSLCVGGYKAAEIHSNRSHAQRREALSGFKSGRYRVLVATDIAARGIDVNDIGTVVNFDLPDNSEDYVHRIGRTGRAGKKGHAVSFATPGQRYGLRSIEKLIRKTLPIAKMPDLPALRESEAKVEEYVDPRSRNDNQGQRDGFRGQRDDSRAPRNEGFRGRRDDSRGGRNEGYQGRRDDSRGGRDDGYQGRREESRGGRREGGYQGNRRFGGR